MTSSGPTNLRITLALTREGMTVKYDAYTIAPYSYGEPELRIPYKDLVGILRPEFIPARN